MPSCDIVRRAEIIDSFRVSQVRGMFDYQKDIVEHEWHVDIPIEDRKWKIGLIVGPSGSGKTTIAREIFPEFRYHEEFKWKSSSVLDDFSDTLTTKEIISHLSSVGFSSPPSWLKSFKHLSNGQKFRVELARALMENKGGLVFDEFTSVVDRDVAKIGSAAVSKLIRKEKVPPFVAISCHYDILEWLQPDWVYDIGDMSFKWRERRRFPEIELRVYRVNRSYWEMFRQHHYLDHYIHKAAACYVATIANRPVAFTSVIHFPHAKCKNFKREHRTVVLPDFQGVGIGNRLSEFIAEMYSKKGYRFISTTSAPAMIHHRHKSEKWRTTRFGNAAKEGKTSSSTVAKTSSHNRYTASFEFNAR